MTTSSLSTIAQFLCYHTLPVNFAKLVGEIDSVIAPLVEAPMRASWDCDNVVCFDQPGTRVLLAWNEYPGHGLGGALTVSVGPSPVQGKRVLLPDHDVLAAQLISYLAERIESTATLHHKIACRMSQEWVDLLIEALPGNIRKQNLSLPAAPKNASTAISMPHLQEVEPQKLITLPMQSTHRPGERERPVDLDLARLRHALYFDEPTERPSNQMRLAVHAMNATLIMVWLPLGVAAMVHGVVRGEDMRLASRLMVMTGSVLALAQSPMGLRAVEFLPI